MANFTNAYTSMSGIDLTAVFGNIIIGTLQGISYSVTREKAPIYTFGSANPRSFSRGKRGIAGSCVFTLFDRSALAQIIESAVDDQSKYYAHAHEPFGTLDPDMQKSVFKLYDQINTLADDDPNKLVATEQRKVEYADQMMPFDVTLVAQNEYGLAAFMVIIGLEILNEGGGLSVDDITNEEQMTYVARGKSPWYPVKKKEGGTTFGPNRANDFSFWLPEGAGVTPSGLVGV